jgi:hypothetical protein
MNKNALDYSRLNFMIGATMTQANALRTTRSQICGGVAIRSYNGARPGHAAGTEEGGGPTGIARRTGAL